MVLDGGMGTELVRCGAQKVDSHRLWSSISNIEEPKVVIQAHLNFINAGSNVIITNSYQSNQFLLLNGLKMIVKISIDARRYSALWCLKSGTIHNDQLFWKKKSCSFLPSIKATTTFEWYLELFS